MALKLITAPAIEPVTLKEAKLHLRLTGTDRDALVVMLIKAVTRRAEVITRTALITQTWEETFDYFPSTIRLEKSPLQSVTSIKYFDVDGVEQTLSDTLYQVDAVSMPSRIIPAYGESWPDLRTEKLNKITIRYVCGFGSEASDVPETVRQWILVRLADLFDNPQAVAIGTIVSELPYSYIDGLLDDVKVWG